MGVQIIHRPPEYLTPVSMMRGNASWAAGLLSACFGMSALMGHPVDDRKQVKTAVPQLQLVSREERKTNPAPNQEAAFTVKHYVHQSHKLSAAEREFVLKRKPEVLRSLSRLGIKCTLESVPHIALLGSGGGQRAAVGLVGSLYQMEKDGLLDTLLYLGGISGSAWAMSSLYSDPQWSANMSAALSRLPHPGFNLEEALAWLGKKGRAEGFSLTDIWGVLTSAEIMKQMDLRHLFEVDVNVSNPYPIYTAVNKNCLQTSSERGKWFEITPHEAGFPDLDLFINTSYLSRRTHEDEQSLINLFPDWLKGLVGTASDEKSLLDVVSPWTEVQQQVKDFWGVMDHYMRGYHSLLKLTEVIRKNTKDPRVLPELDNLEKTLKGHMNLYPAATFGKMNPEQQKRILEQWRRDVKPLQNWIQSLDGTPITNETRTNIFPPIQKWEWGTTENFLYQYPGAGVPSCIRLKQHLQLKDTGTMHDMPYPPFLGQKRDADLLIALDYEGGGTFQTLTLASDYAATMKKPFPEINVGILEERDWPKDFYVFEGKEKEPTVIYMPLFNRNNCKDSKEIKARVEEFSTFQLPLSPEKLELLLETAKANMKNNKENLLKEIYKAALRRHNRSYNMF